MSSVRRLVAFAGSTRRESLNWRFPAVAVDALPQAGAEVALLDLRDFALPLDDGDLEDAAGLPGNAQKLIAPIAGHHGLLVAAPEHNGMPRRS